MTIEQSAAIVGFIVALALAIVGSYYTRRSKFRFPVAMAGLLFFSTSVFVIRSFEGDAIGIFFLWISTILGFSLSLDILTWRRRELNIKLVVSSWLVVTSVGGILTNAHIFSVPASGVARIFSISVLILVHVPILFALIAHLSGKKELSKRLVNLGHSRDMKNGA